MKRTIDNLFRADRVLKHAPLQRRFASALHLLFAAALMAASCTMEEPTQITPEDTSKVLTWTVTVEAAKGEGTVTKVTLGNDGWEEEEVDTKGLELDGGNYLKSTWEFKEKAFVYNGETLVGELESQRFGENSTVLAGSITGSYKVDDVLDLYLIGPEDERSYIGQKGTLEDIAENFDYARAQVQIKSIDSKSGAIILTDANFNNLQSINEFSFGVLKVKSLTISGAGIVGRNDREAYVTVTPETPTNKLYVAMSSSLTGKKISYEFLMESEDGRVLTKTKKATLEDGKFYKAGINSYSLYDADKTPLTFEMLEEGRIVIKNPKNLEIRWAVNGSDFVSSSDSDIYIENLNLGDKVVLCGKNQIYGDGSDDPEPADCTRIYVDKGKAYIYGNINSLRDPFTYYNTSGNPALLKAGKTAYVGLFYVSSGNKIYNHPYKDILLPATEVGELAYYGMFSQCTNLTRAPKLPATTLAKRCYRSMFSYCYNLKQAPELPALQLAEDCYYRMFVNCLSLETAPELPAENLKAGWNGCYAEMFRRCSNLKQITCLAKNPAPEYMWSWVEGVPSSGYFIQHPDASWISGVSGIPAGWGGQEPLTIEAIEDGTITINNPQRLTLRYSTAANMSLGDATSSSKEQIEISVSAGDKLRLWGDNAAYGHEDGPVSCTNIIGSGLHYVYGDLCSLISSGAYTSVTTLAPYAFASLFSGNDKLMSHPTEELVIRPTAVGDGCFRDMFNGCIALERAPELPATVIGRECYASMFYDCGKLITAPALNATALAPYCYAGMFQTCVLLSTAPDLPATNLAEGCYSNMFDGCSNLTAAPALKASTLAMACYSYMFRDCSRLKAVTCLATNPALSDYSVEPYVLGNVDGWLDGTASGGTLTKESGVNWPSGSVPSGWNVNNVQ